MTVSHVHGLVKYMLNWNHLMLARTDVLLHNR